MVGAMLRGVGTLVAAALVPALLMTSGATSVSAASPTSCRVQDTDTGKTYTALQDAVDAASKGDRLTVRGTCRGPTVMDRDLVIDGVAGRAGRALLHGDHEGVVVTIPKGVTVLISDVKITGGWGHSRKGGSKKPWKQPAGVRNQANLTLRGVLVKGNKGIGIVNTGRLRLNGRSVVGPNGFAGNNEYTGVHNTGALRLNGRSRVGGNVRGVVNEGVLVLNGASRIGNNGWNVNRGSLALNDESGIDGFDDVVNRGTLTFNDHSRFVGLVTRDGVSVSGSLDNYGRLILNDTSRISDHELTAVWNSGTFTMNDDSRVSHNGDFRYEVAPAVINTGRLTLNGTSHISDNWMGVENENSGSITLNGSGSIRDNHRTQYRSSCPHWCPPTPRLVGAGVANKGSLTLNDSSSITGNSAAESGAGVYLWEGTGASLTMTGSSTISGNTTGKTGGGIYAGAGSTLIGVSCGPQTLANVYGNTPDDCYLEP